MALNSGSSMSLGTHDPELIEWATKQPESGKAHLEVSFLKGLADRTKIDLAERGGWCRSMCRLAMMPRHMRRAG